MTKEIQDTERKERYSRLRPATDILEREDGFHVYMDLPGVPKENLMVDLREKELVVTGKTGTMCGPEEQFVEVQFTPGEFYRSVALSDMVDRERIKATLKNGILELLIPKAEKLLPRKIEIQAE